MVSSSFDSLELTKVRDAVVGVCVRCVESLVCNYQDKRREGAQTHKERGHLIPIRNDRLCNSGVPVFVCYLLFLLLLSFHRWSSEPHVHTVIFLSSNLISFLLYSLFFYFFCIQNIDSTAAMNRCTSIGNIHRRKASEILMIHPCNTKLHSPLVKLDRTEQTKKREIQRITFFLQKGETGYRGSKSEEK